MRTRALSIHADYACRSSGACCTSGWAIAVEPDVEVLLLGAEASGALPRASRRLVPAPGLPGQARSVLATDACGTCGFFEGATRLCGIHRTLGHDALPSACRHFPRVALLAPGSVSVTLSHYCPTAAALLFRDDVPLAIVENPPAFPIDREYEGLDARAAWPPLVRPDVLLGWEGHEAWERATIALLSRDDVTAYGALAVLGQRAERLRAWRASDGPFEDALRAALAIFEAEPTQPTLAACLDAHAVVRGCVPEGLASPRPADGLAEPDWSAFDAIVRRYLAARAFASWVALQGGGLRAVVRALEATLAVLRVAMAVACTEAQRALDRELLTTAIRRSDLLLLHEARPEELARAWSTP